MEVILFGSVFIVVVVILVIQAIYNAISSEVKRTTNESRIAKARKQILQATGDETITQHMMWLREDLTPYSRLERYRDKLQAICDKPQLAVTAFETALKSADHDLRYVAIRGLAYLKDPSGIGFLMEYRTTEYDLNDETADALIELSAFAPIQGANSYITAFQHILSTPCGYTKLRKKVGSLQRLLAIAEKRLHEFSDEDFEILVKSSNEYADKLIASRETDIRHVGEDLKKTILSAQSKREKRARGFHSRESLERERQEQDRLRRERQAQRETEARERQRQEEKRREEERRQQRERYRAHAEREYEEQQGAKQATKQNSTDYYKILQVDPSAEPEVIQSAYRRLAAKYHPDINPAPEATKIMQLLNEAYAVLSDTVKRRLYDEIRTQL